MACKSIFVSDLSGAEIAEGKGAQITIRFNDAMRNKAALSDTEELFTEAATATR